MKASNVVSDLKKISSVAKAKTSSWFFKTGKGEYGEGDKFIGVSVPNQRLIAKKYLDLSHSEIKKLLESKIHENRFTALEILAMSFRKSDSKNKAKIAKFYFKNKKYVNNWDLVDTSASYILGEYLSDKDRSILYKLAKSKVLWDRRIAVVATHSFIKKGDFVDIIELSKYLMNDKEDLMHKAVGWMLREVGKKDRKTLIDYLNVNSKLMPRTALRYSIEHFSPTERKKFMQK